MANFQIMYWHDIPSQVRARGEGRERASVQLSQRFQEAIDSAAMAAKLTGSDEYAELFHWSGPVEQPGSAAQVAAAVAADIESTYVEIDWRATARALREKTNGGTAASG